MKRILFIVGAIITMGLCANAQVSNNDEVEIETNDVELQLITPAEPVKESKKEIKEREKKLRELNDDVAYAKASNSLRRGYFVLLADAIERGRSGYRNYSINPNSNFIVVQGDDAIIQFALNTGSFGANGLGGWTGKGQVRNKRIKYEENGDVFMQFSVVGPHVNADVFITLYHNGKRATASVNNVGANLTYYGDILPYRDKEHR